MKRRTQRMNNKREIRISNKLCFLVKEFEYL